MLKNVKRMVAVVMAVMMIVGTGATANVQAAGCSKYILQVKGDARCTNKLCPNANKRKERQDKYRQKCVRDNATIYYNYKYKTVLIDCSCK